MKRITKEQREYLITLQDRAEKAMGVRRKEAQETPMTIDNVFEYTPEGDFKWEQDEAGDWHVYNCGDKDCPVGWHLIAYAQNFSRKNDKKTIELMSVDSDGNWDLDCCWESGEDPHDILFIMQMQTWDYFYGWFQYWIDCACTGNDILDQAGNSHKNVSAYIKFAEDNLKSLENVIASNRK